MDSALKDSIILTMTNIPTTLSTAPIVTTRKRMNEVFLAANLMTRTKSGMDAEVMQRRETGRRPLLSPLLKVLQTSSIVLPRRMVLVSSSSAFTMRPI